MTNFHDSVLPKNFQLLTCNLEITGVTSTPNLSATESSDVL